MTLTTKGIIILTVTILLIIALIIIAVIDCVKLGCGFNFTPTVLVVIIAYFILAFDVGFTESKQVFKSDFDKPVVATYEAVDYDETLSNYYFRVKSTEGETKDIEVPSNRILVPDDFDFDNRFTINEIKYTRQEGKLVILEGSIYTLTPEPQPL